MQSIQEISAHRNNGWQGQYNRVRRWADKFKKLSFVEDQGETTHYYFDTMYACFQNIFFLKDWLLEESPLTLGDLNEFVKGHKEIGICRDICNGTKHYNISNPSVDKEFGVIKQYNPYHKLWNTEKWEIIICSGGDTFKPLDLINKCIDLWDDFIAVKLNLRKRKS